jgi:hypothetical protein
MSEQLEATSRVSRIDLLWICFLPVRGVSARCSVNTVARIFLITPVQMVVKCKCKCSISKALSGLDALSAEMRTMAGVE